jgi:hypothetical protein
VSPFTIGPNTLQLAGDERAFQVQHYFTRDRAIVRFEGTYALVDRVVVSADGLSDRFEISARPASLEEQVFLNPLLAAISSPKNSVSQDDIITLPEPLESVVLDETGEYEALAEPVPETIRAPRPGFCHCGTALSVVHEHANAPNLDKCWCGLYLAHAHSHAAAPVEAIARCHCGILVSVPHEHATVPDPTEKCWCGIAMNPPHEHASGPRRH